MKLNQLGEPKYVKCGGKGSIEKRLYNRETIIGVQDSGLVKIPTLYHDWLGSMNEEKGELFEDHIKDIF